jgi:hypothetical protein
MPRPSRPDHRITILARNLWLIGPAAVIFSIDGWLFRHLSDPLAAAIGAVGVICFLAGVARIAAGFMEAGSSASKTG